MCSSPRSPAARTSCRASRSAVPMQPVYRGELQSRGLGMKVEIFDDEGRPVRGERGELVCTAPFPSMPVGFWNDPDGTQVSRGVLRALPERLAPRRLRHAHRARRPRHPWPLGCGAESGRRAHRHGGDLRGGREPGRDRRGARRGAGLARRRARRAVRAPEAGRRRSTKRCRRRSATPSARHHAAARAGARSSPCRIFRARCPARSPSSPCAT